VALLLRRRGIARVRPLAGGFDAWRERGYPVERFVPTAQIAAPGKPVETV
jgi:3-mercaptopyruvate sulfurtransferase SseA